MGRALARVGGEAKSLQRFGGETRDHMEYVGISETMIGMSTLNGTERCGLGSYGSGTVMRCYECGSESIRFYKIR